MKIEILYVAECPSHSAAVKLVRDVLSSEGLAAEVRELLIIDETVAAALGFRGSPTIRIDGRSDLAAGCIRDQLESAFPRRTWCAARWLLPERKADHEAGGGISASLGAVLSSVATISCCLPFGFAAALGAGAVSAFFTTLRPWFLGLSVALGLGFWQQHRAKQCHFRAEGLAWCCFGPRWPLSWG
jgi:hypothetical protein